MDPITQQTALATAGAAGAGEGLYVDDVFSTYVYEGDNTNRTITNDIDLAGEGGLVWIKNRTGSYWNVLFDTERGAGQISSNQTDAELASSSNVAGYVSAYNSDGFSVSAGSSSRLSVNTSGYNYASWTFRKAPGFFDVVTYTGTGTARTVAHNLGSVPGTIIVKRTNAASSWYVYHRSIGATKEIRLNSTNAENTSSIYWNDTEPTSSVFTVGTSSGVNAVGDTYVAYIFAHDDQSFGTNEDESVIKCGSYTGTGTAGNFVDLGFEPQFLIVKKSSNTGSWFVCDSMRGMADSTNGNNFIRAHSDVAEQNTTAFVAQSTGFRIDSTGPESNNSGGTFIYMAIRRPHKPPTAGTEVFAPQATRGATDGTPSDLAFTAGFPVDLLLYTHRNYAAGAHSVLDRMRGAKWLETASTAAETNSDHKLDSNEGVYMTVTASATSVYGGLMFKRAPGFFDIVSYEGTGSAQTVDHNLTVAPELIIAKCRNTASTTWLTYASSLGATKYLELNDDGAEATATSVWNDTAPTSSVFSVGTSSGINGSGRTYVAYLFASLDGISKVGSYTGNGGAGNALINVDCGFTSGARFVLIKRTDSNGDWFVYDTARGINFGDDPYILLNSSAAEVTNTDYIKPYSAGFAVLPSSGTSPINASGGTYIYLAIA